MAVRVNGQTPIAALLSPAPNGQDRFRDRIYYSEASERSLCIGSIEPPLGAEAIVKYKLLKEEVDVEQENGGAVGQIYSEDDMQQENRGHCTVKRSVYDSTWCNAVDVRVEQFRAHIGSP
jgi:hypothetical protein